MALMAGRMAGVQFLMQQAHQRAAISRSITVGLIVPGGSTALLRAAVPTVPVIIVRAPITTLSSTARVLRVADVFVLPSRFSHERVFMRRTGHMYWQKYKDALHFYMIGIGLLPFFILLMYSHIVFGNCELSDYPGEGEEPPRFWQFERTALKQWYCWLWGLSDMEMYERNMSLCERKSILVRWRRLEQRVKHLIGERWDYKAYYYQPISSAWVDHGRNLAERLHHQYEEHGHYAY